MEVTVFAYRVDVQNEKDALSINVYLVAFCIYYIVK